MRVTRHVSNFVETAASVSFDLVVDAADRPLTPFCYGGGLVTLQKPLVPGAVRLALEQAVQNIVAHGTPASTPSEPPERLLQNIVANLNEGP